MNFWRQSSRKTKTILLVLGIVIIVLVILILIRTDIIKVGGSSESNGINEINSTSSAIIPTITNSLQSTTPAEETIPVVGNASITASVDTTIYNGPGTDYEPIARLLAGQSAEVSGTSPDRLWWQMIIPEASGTKGWVISNDVIAENIENVPIVDPGTEPSPEVPPEPDVYGTVTAITTVNIRGGPGITYEIVGTLEQGKVADVLGISVDRLWWYITIPDTEGDVGWVFDEIVTSENTENAPTVDQDGNELPGQIIIPTPVPGSPQLTALANVNIRSGPGIEFEKIGLFTEGKSAQVIGVSQDGTWWAIVMPSAEKGRGWVNDGFVTTENTDEVPIIENP